MTAHLRLLYGSLRLLILRRYLLNLNGLYRDLLNGDLLYLNRLYLYRLRSRSCGLLSCTLYGIVTKEESGRCLGSGSFGSRSLCLGLILSPGSLRLGLLLSDKLRIAAGQNGCGCLSACRCIYCIVESGSDDRDHELVLERIIDNCTDDDLGFGRNFLTNDRGSLVDLGELHVASAREVNDNACSAVDSRIEQR